MARAVNRLSVTDGNNGDNTDYADVIEYPRYASDEINSA
jgi:hypothetical protein